MLEIVVSSGEFWNDEAQEFYSIKPCVLQLEHSLLSIARWESKWEKPFFSKEERSHLENISYIQCMCLKPVRDPRVFDLLSEENFAAIEKYLTDSHSATTIRDRGRAPGGRGSFVTSELIYYWMITYSIPFECEKWNISRLLKLIDICRIKNDPKKMSKRETAKSYAELNRTRRAKAHSKG